MRQRLSDRDGGRRGQGLSVLRQGSRSRYNDVDPHAVAKAHVVRGVQSPVRRVATRSLRSNHGNRQLSRFTRLDSTIELELERLGDLVTTNVQQASAYRPVNSAVVHKSPDLDEFGASWNLGAIRNVNILDKLGAWHNGEVEDLLAKRRHYRGVLHGLLVLIKGVAESSVDTLAHAQLAQVIVGTVLALVANTIDTLLTTVTVHVRVVNALWLRLRLRLRLRLLDLGLLRLLRRRGLLRLLRLGLLLLQLLRR